MIYDVEMARSRDSAVLLAERKDWPNNSDFQWNRMINNFGLSWMI